MRELLPGDGSEGDVLVVDGDGGGEAADQRRELGRPHSTGVHDVLGLDRPRRSVHRPDLSVRAQVEPRHASMRLDPDAEVSGRVRKGVRGDVRVDGAVVSDPDRPVKVSGRGGRQHPHGFLGRDHLHVEADPARPARPALELLQAVGARCDAQAPDGLEDTELAVELDAVAAKAIIVGEGLNWVTRPAAWQVDPLVSSSFSTRRTSFQPCFARW